MTGATRLRRWRAGTIDLADGSGLFARGALVRLDASARLYRVVDAQGYRVWIRPARLAELRLRASAAARWTWTAACDCFPVLRPLGRAFRRHPPRSVS